MALKPVTVTQLNEYISRVLGLSLIHIFSTYTGALGGAFDIKIDCDQFKASLEFQTDKNDLASGCGTEAQDVL